MKNKIIVELIIPEIEEKYSLYIPVTKKIGEIIPLLAKAVADFSYGSYTYNEKTALYNAITTERYEPNDMIINTDIRNGTQLILL